MASVYEGTVYSCGQPTCISLGFTRLQLTSQSQTWAFPVTSVLGAVEEPGIGSPMFSILVFDDYSFEVTLHAAVYLH